MKGKLSIFALSLLLCCACSGFLDEYPDTQLSEGAIYNTEEALEAHLYGCHAGFTNSNNTYVGRMNEYLHTASGLLHWGRSRSTDAHLSGLKLTKYATDDVISNCYGALYSSISRCNKLLYALPGSPVGEDFKREVEAETKMLRAVLYFTLVRMFGDVPLVLTPPRNARDVNNPRAPWYKVYETILNDLDYAEKYMRSPGRQYQATGDPSRPSYWAATAFKAAVYLQIGSLMSSPDDNFWDNSRPERRPDFASCGILTAEDAFAKALAASESVINDGPYELAGNYNDLFRWTGQEDYLLKERIFTLQVNAKVTQTSMLATYSLPDYPGGTNVTESNVNAGRVRPDRWLFQKWCESFNGRIGTSANNSGAYINCDDPRLAATMYYNSYIKCNTGNSFSLYPSNTYIFHIDNDRAFPYLKKYWDPLYTGDNGNADFYMMRLAEMYLTAAEASASLSQSPGDSYWTKALDYIEVLHQRARRSVEPESDQPTWNDGRHEFATKDELIHAIVWEREFEMCGEGHEFFDTHRRGATFLRDHVAVPKNEYFDARHQQTIGSGKTSTIHAYYYKSQYYPTDVQELRRSLLCAFPLTETIYNTEVGENDQNDYYWQ